MSKTLNIYFNRNFYIKKFLHFKLLPKKFNKLNNNYFILRYQPYLEIKSEGVLQPEKMPPINRAAFFHGLRAHHQIVIWKMVNDKNVILGKKAWGWFLSEDVISPIITDNDVAPKSLLKVVRCTCKSSTNQCRSNRCSVEKID